MADRRSPSIMSGAATPDLATHHNLERTTISAIAPITNVAYNNDCSADMESPTRKPVPSKMQTHGETVLEAWQRMLHLLDGDDGVVVDGDTLNVAKVIAVAR